LHAHAYVSHASLYLSLRFAISQLNRLYCSGYYCPRSIFQFPLKYRWRIATYASYLERQALRNAAIQGRERGGRGEGEEEGEGEQATGKLTDLFTDRYRQTNSSRAANPLLKLLVTPQLDRALVLGVLKLISLLILGP
jgi:hypothetical protein